MLSRVLKKTIDKVVGLRMLKGFLLRMDGLGSVRHYSWVHSRTFNNPTSFGCGTENYDTEERVFLLLLTHEFFLVFSFTFLFGFG